MKQKQYKSCGSSGREYRKTLLKDLKSLYASKSTAFLNIDQRGLSFSQGYLSFKNTAELVEKADYQNLQVQEIVESIVNDLGEFAFTQANPT